MQAVPRQTSVDLTDSSHNVETAADKQQKHRGLAAKGDGHRHTPEVVATSPIVMLSASLATIRLPITPPVDANTVSVMSMCPAAAPKRKAVPRVADGEIATTMKKAGGGHVFRQPSVGGGCTGRIKFDDATDGGRLRIDENISCIECGIRASKQSHSGNI